MYRIFLHRFVSIDIYRHLLKDGKADVSLSERQLIPISTLVEEVASRRNSDLINYYYCCDHFYVIHYYSLLYDVFYRFLLLVQIECIKFKFVKRIGFIFIEFDI